MSTNLSDTASTLNDLIETCKDGQEGFRVASEAIDQDDDLKAFLFSCSLQRSKFAGELQSQLMALGESEPTQRGSVSSMVHRGWINLKSVITMRDNHAILAECERGEDATVATYRKAVDSGLPADLREVVQEQFQEILATHNTVRDMRDELAALKRKPGEVIGDLGAAIGAKSRAFGASASQGWEDARSRGSDMLQTTEFYVRENPIPAILTALGVGFVLGLLVRSMEREDDEHVQIPIPRAVRKARDFDVKAAALPLLWPVVKFFSSNYASSAAAVNKAYKKAKQFDPGDYIDPVVKKVKKVKKSF